MREARRGGRSYTWGRYEGGASGEEWGGTNPLVSACREGRARRVRRRDARADRNRPLMFAFWWRQKKLTTNGFSLFGALLRKSAADQKLRVVSPEERGSIYQEHASPLSPPVIFSAPLITWGRG